MRGDTPGYFARESPASRVAPAEKRFLLVVSAASALGGIAAVSLGVVVTPSEAGPDKVLGLSLVIGGFLAFAAGLYGLVTWLALSAVAQSESLIQEADMYLARGKADWALTLYEEALRHGADPEYVEPRIVTAQSRLARRQA